ncbi:hypothetical protein M405DRAFT_933036 [Rhizopogon salebrosus TDB-379]|nr:hypothetical protein M405DRAFT_933036 [Rhizopogon salebrosus TDB-379]
MEEADQRALMVRSVTKGIIYRTSYARNESRQAKFTKLTYEVIDDVREIFPHGQIIPATIGLKGIRIEKPEITDDWFEHVVHNVLCTTMKDGADQRAFKDSSTELEEAIRSMFKWYRDAYVCIAYLSDTTSMDDLHEDVWFTRGWTLQELLAPWRMKFYGANWIPLTSNDNDKENMELMAALSGATRIPLDDLRHFQPGTKNVHQKMMWASTRTTTRIEDVAYSLIGIFDVTMMIAYGEGKRAFHRLMEVIVHKCDEWQIFAWAGPSSSDSAAFPDSPRGYLPLDPVDSNDALLPSTVWRGDQGIAVTKRGLQMQVLLVDLSLQEVTVYEKIGILNVRTEAYSHYTAGVVDYWCFDASGDGILKPEQEHLCVLLRPDPRNPYAGWRKVTTANLVTIRTESKLRKTLTTVWL